MWYISVSGDSIRTLSQWVCLQCSHIRVSVSSALDVYTGQGCGLLSRVINHAVSCTFLQSTQLISAPYQVVFV